MRRLADQRGFTVIELLVAATLMVFVMGATMTLLTSATSNQKLVEQHNEAQQNARSSLDRLARDLRNVAAPTDLSVGGIVAGGTLPRGIERNGPNDLVVRVVDEVRPAGSLNVANVKRVRYCLNTSDPQRGVLWQQSQTWTTAQPPTTDPPADTACPGSGWKAGADRILATGVVNAAGGQLRPVFRYAGDAGTITAPDQASRADILRVRADLHIDADATRAPRASHLATAVFLRNQNREPLATFTITGLNPTTRLIDLNGTGSNDPEGHRLRFQFYYDPPSPLPNCRVATPHASCIKSDAARVQFIAPAPGEHVYVLSVTDPSGLSGTSTQRFIYP